MALAATSAPATSRRTRNGLPGSTGRVLFVSGGVLPCGLGSNAVGGADCAVCCAVPLVCFTAVRLGGEAHIVVGAFVFFVLGVRSVDEGLDSKVDTPSSTLHCWHCETAAVGVPDYIFRGKTQEPSVWRRR